MPGANQVADGGSCARLKAATWREGATLVLAVPSMLLLGGCHGSSSTADATAAAARPMEARLDSVHRCLEEAYQRAGFPTGAYVGLLRAKGLASEMHADARSFDAEFLAQAEAGVQRTDSNSVVDDSNRVVDSYTLFLGGTADPTYSADKHVKAKALLAYYQSKVFPAGTCPLDPDILQLINKTKP